MTAKLLIVDDEPNVRYSLSKAFSSPDWEVTAVGTAREAIAAVKETQPDVMLLDLRLPDMTGLEAFAVIREDAPSLPVILITAHATTETAIEAMKQGVFEYLLKPVDLAQLREVVGKALELSRMRRVPAVFDGAGEGSEEVDLIVGKSSAMQAVYKAIGRVAAQDVNVLILGESGTGKELVARALFQHSKRHNGPFLAINCAALAENLLESELFGHERGSFTGADRRRIGKFEQANKGTLFLDEIGDMSPSVQAKVLRILQEQRFERLGSNDSIQADVRVIAATHYDLEKQVAEGKFRRDLFYRLNAITIRLPAVRERSDDIPLLIDHFLKQHSKKMAIPIPQFTQEAQEALFRHDWPGNVRELQHVIQYAILHAQGGLITPESLPVLASTNTPEPSSDSIDELLRIRVRDLLARNEADIYKKMEEFMSRIVLTEVLQHTNGGQAEASKLLGVARNTLRNKLRELGISVAKQVSETDQSDQ